MFTQKMVFEICFYYNPRGGSRHYKWNNTDYTVGMLEPGDGGVVVQETIFTTLA